MQENKEQSPPAAAPPPATENQMAQNPNPRANENIKNTSFDKTDATDNNTPTIGSEITDGDAG